MKLRTSTIVVVALSLSPFAMAQTLDNLLVIASAYTELGQDNNYIDSEMMTLEEFSPYQKYAQQVVIDNSDNTPLQDAVASCVFMEEGAYGSHFEADLRKRMVEQFSYFLTNQFDAAKLHTVYKLDSKHTRIASGIFNAPCVLVVVDDGKALMMQAAAMD